jgi:hypothetical protein
VITREQLLKGLTMQLQLLKTRQELLDVIIEKLKNSELEEREDMTTTLTLNDSFEELVRFSLFFLSLNEWVN